MLLSKEKASFNFEEFGNQAITEMKAGKMKHSLRVSQKSLKMILKKKHTNKK
jgi:hypothetical protein